MVKKLAEASLGDYLPYKGVDLTPAGKRIAATVLRHRRLWEFFLVEHLHIPIGDADALACRLEHITTDEVGQRLSSFLGNPSISPQGKPIPSQGSEPRSIITYSLCEQMVGEQHEVVEVNTDPAITSFLQAKGIQPGAEVTVLARDNDGTILLSSKVGQISLSELLAAKIRTR